MSAGGVFILIVVGMFPTLIIVALVVKLWEVRQVSRWPMTTGKVLVSRVKSHQNQPGDPGYNFSDTEVSNQPFVEYEYKVDGKKYRCSRLSIGEKIPGEEVESYLERFRVGAEVTVFYNPADPSKAMLERDLPWGVMAAGFGCLMLFFIGGPALVAAIYFSLIDRLKDQHDPRPDGKAAAYVFAGAVYLFCLAFLRYVLSARSWPTVPGRIVAGEVDEFLSRSEGDGSRRRVRMYKPSLLYTYEVNGRQYSGDRVTIGVVVSSTVPGIARFTANRYPVGSDVDVHYNPKNPGECVLKPFSVWHLFPLAIVVGPPVWMIGNVAGWF